MSEPFFSNPCWLPDFAVFREARDEADHRFDFYEMRNCKRLCSRRPGRLLRLLPYRR